MLHIIKPDYNGNGESARSRYDDDHMVVESFDPPACDGYLHPGNCRICYDTLAAFNDEDFSFSAFRFLSDSNKVDLQQQFLKAKLLLLLIFPGNQAQTNGLVHFLNLLAAQ